MPHWLKKAAIQLGLTFEEVTSADGIEADMYSAKQDHKLTSTEFRAAIKAMLMEMKNEGQFTIRWIQLADLKDATIDCKFVGPFRRLEAYDVQSDRTVTRIDILAVC